MSSRRLLTYYTFAILFLGSVMNAQETTMTYENGNDKLVVYSDVPGLEQPEEHYRIRVRSNASNDAWQECYGMVTRALYENPDDRYFDNLDGWTHTYANIEMNSPVEVEIAKADGTPITKAAVHPHAKGSAVTIVDGKAYFTMDKPAQVAIDIDGQMDDHDTGRDQFAQPYNGPAIHAVSIFANPIFEKPDSTATGVKVVHPGEEPPADPGTFNTLYFAPGVHNIGKAFQVHKNKNYYIPGDAIVYGTFQNLINDNGMNIHLYGLGTISGDSIRHPLYDPDFTGESDDYKPICIMSATNTRIEGVCLANPAMHALKIWASGDNGKVTAVRWAKVISWRVNGDGFGSPHIVEDCFLRTQDDATYIKGDRKRCVIWNDANGAAFVLSMIPDDWPIVVEDCDVIYSRAKWHLWDGGRVFTSRPIVGTGQNKVNVLFRDIRIEDKRPTLQIFNLISKNDIDASYFPSTDGKIGQSWSGIKFQNITAEGSSVVGFPELLHGCAESPFSDLTFENVTIDGKLFTGLDDFADVNEYVTDITFNSGITDDATLFDLQMDGVSLPEFDPAKEDYYFEFPFGTLDIPKFTATRADYGASVSITEATSLPGQTTITVTAEDGVTTKTYTMHFGLGSDEVVSFTAPEVVKQGDTIMTTVVYSATEERDLWVFFQLNSPPWDMYGSTKFTVPAGRDTLDVEIVLDLDVPIRSSAYKTVVNLLPVGLGWTDRIDEVILKDRSVISRYSSDATLSGITVNGESLAGFSSGKTTYDIILPAGTVDVPVISAQVSDAGASALITDAASLPGATRVLVTAEDGTATQTYSLNFILEGINDFSAPASVTQGETVKVQVAYAASETRDILVSLVKSGTPGTSYGESRMTVSAGPGNSEIEVIVDASIPVEENAYTFHAGLVPVGGSWEEMLSDGTLENIDAVAPLSSDATLAELTYNGLPVPGFDAGVFSYNIELPAGTTGMPDVEGFSTDEGAMVEITKSENLPGSVSVQVTAQDGQTTLTYSIDFTVAIPDEIMEIVAPSEVIPGDTILVSVTYSAYTDRDIIVMIYASADSVNSYGSSGSTATMGTGNVEIELIVGNDIPIAEGAYTISASLVPAGATLSESLYTAVLNAIDAVAPTTISDQIYGRNNEAGIFFYPNPFTGDIHIQNKGMEHYAIYSIDGQKIFDSKNRALSEQTVIAAHSWTDGIYVLVSESGIAYKLIKQ